MNLNLIKDSLHARYHTLFNTLTSTLNWENQGTALESHVKTIQDLALEAKEHFLRNERPLLELKAKITVCGDIHGQYSDLLRIIECGGPISHNNSYLFLGDYVDRGKQSLETLVFLLLCKIAFPNNFFLLRGNHECASINRHYGFYDECKGKFPGQPRIGISLWKTFTNVFNVMPIAALIEGKIFCVHGGLSPELTRLEQINTLLRPTDVPETGLLCDLLWSDPTSDFDHWHNNDRGVSYTFGKEVVKSFCEKFGVELICRAHQVVEDGYEFFAGQRLITLFSAPNYGGEFVNCAAMMVVDKDLVCSVQVLRPSNTVVAGSRTAVSPKPKNEARPKANAVGVQYYNNSHLGLYNR